MTYLESFILKDAFDGGVFTRGRELCLKDNAKGAASYDAMLCVDEFSCLASSSILDLFSDEVGHGVGE